MFVHKKSAPVLARQNQADLAVLQGFLESGQVTPVMGRRYDVADVPDAFRHLEQGHAIGKIVINLA